MNPDPTLSERLKRLDEAQPVQEWGEFDLGAVMRRGERRRRRRAVGGAIALTSGVGLLVAALFTGVVPDVFQAGSDSSPAGSVQVSDGGLVYAQQGDSVTVSSSGRPVGEVTLVSAGINSAGRVAVRVRVDSQRPFLLNASEFVWAGTPLGASPTESERVFQAAGTGVQTFGWAYDTLPGQDPDDIAGQLAWVLPGSGRLVGAWDVSTAGVGGKPRQVWYLQSGDEVTVYRGEQVETRVTVSGIETAVSGSRIRIEAGALRLKAGEFLWETSDGSDLPAEADGTGDSLSLKVPAGGARTLIWMPDDAPVAVWRIAGGGR